MREKDEGHERRKGMVMNMNQYLAIFLDGTKEHLQNLNRQILALESDPENAGTVNEIFRSAHLLKGMAGTMGYKRMQNLTGDMANVLSEVRSGNIAMQSDMVDVLFQCLDALEESMDSVKKTGLESASDNESVRRQLNAILQSSRNAAAYAGKQTRGEAGRTADALPWNEIALDGSQTKVILEAGAQGKHIYGINVAVQENCMLKAARAFMVFRALEEKGEIIVSSPGAGDLEDEKFDEDFTLIVVSDESLEGLLDVVANIAEISDVTGAPLKLEGTKHDSGAKGAQERAAEAKKAEQAFSPAEENRAKAVAAKPALSRTVRVDMERLDGLMRLANELGMAKSALVSALGSEAFAEQVARLESVTASLQEAVMKVRMVSMENAFHTFPRRVRDLARAWNKPIELYLSGGDTEIDRAMADELGEPLMRLIKHAAEYGLESAAVRAQRGKSPVGVISLKAYHEGGHVVVEVGDDGNGDVLLQPGASAAEQMMDISDKGTGPDAARAKIVSLGGTLEVRSEYGKGSTWIVRMPMSLASIQAIAAHDGEPGLDVNALL